MGKLKDELIDTFAGIRSLACAATPGTTAIRPLDSISFDELLVTRMNNAAAAARSVMKYRLRYVITGNDYLFTTFHVGDTAVVHRI